MKSSQYLKYLYVLDKVSGEVIFKCSNGVGEFITGIAATPNKIYVKQTNLMEQIRILLLTLKVILAIPEQQEAARMGTV